MVAQAKIYTIRFALSRLSHLKDKTKRAEFKDTNGIFNRKAFDAKKSLEEQPENAERKLFP